MRLDLFEWIAPEKEGGQGRKGLAWPASTRVRYGDEEGREISRFL